MFGANGTTQQIIIKILIANVFQRKTLPETRRRNEMET